MIQCCSNFFVCGSNHAAVSPIVEKLLNSSSSVCGTVFQSCLCDSIVTSAFQVETIGDCLLVVSGLPVRNGNRHAGEIADMAFDILSLMTHFKIRHRPRMKLQLRVGLHSGKIWGTTVYTYIYIYISNCRQYCFGLLGLISAVPMLGWR